VAACNKVANCVDDGVCDTRTEGCLCGDCRDSPNCNGYPGSTSTGSM
jgi:hypothetical protein